MWIVCALLCHLQLCLLFVLTVHGATGPPRLLGRKQETYTANVGDTVKLKCRATGANDALALRTLFFWKKLDSKRVIRSSKDFPRYKIKQGKYLKIKNVRLEDSGKYLCSATNRFGLVTAFRILKVNDDGKGNFTKPKQEKPTKRPSLTLTLPVLMQGDEGPPFFRNGAANNTKVRQVEHPIGYMARLKCPVGGKPSPSIMWSKDGIPITKNRHVRLGQSNSVLVFKTLKKEDSGNYTCVASNSHGAIKMRFVLKVKSFVRFRDPVTKRVRNVTGVLGKNLTLSCRTDIKGRRGGLPRLHWIKWNSNLRTQKQFPAPRQRMTSARSAKSGDRSKWDYSSNGNGSLIGTLTLINVTVSDQGRYSCMAGTGRRWNTIEEVYVVIVRDFVKPSSGESKTGISYEIPILILILVPTAAGILCIAVAFCCWHFSRKKRRKKFPENIPLRDKPLQNGSGCYDTETSKFLNHSRRSDKEDDTPVPNGTALHLVSSDLNGVIRIDSNGKVSSQESPDPTRHKVVESKPLCNGYSSPVNNSHCNNSSKSHPGSPDICTDNHSNGTYTTPANSSPRRTLSCNGNGIRSPGKGCSAKNSRICLKANGIKLSDCRFQSTDAVAIKTNAIISSNAETRTL